MTFHADTGESSTLPPPGSMRMASMTSKHAQGKPRSRGDVWFVLILTGGTSAVLQMWHATHASGTVLLIAALVGLVPAATAIGLSHVVASHKSILMLRLVTFAVMLMVMAASASAAAAVVQPIDGPYFSWVLCIALDAAALACVWVLLGDNERKAAEALALVEAREATVEAAEKVSTAEGKVSRLEGELAEVTAALERERQKVLPRKRRRSSARKPARPEPGTGTRNLAPVPPLTPVTSSGPEDVPDLDTEARILALIAEGHSASQAGIMAGKSDSYGRQVARLARAAQREPAGGERTEGDVG